MANSLITGGASASPVSPSEATTTEKDTRIFMYRDGESRLFDSAEQIPAGEGWVDHPDKVQKTQPVKRKPRKQLEATEPETEDGDIQ